MSIKRAHHAGMASVVSERDGRMLMHRVLATVDAEQLGRFRIQDDASSTTERVRLALIYDRSRHPVTEKSTFHSIPRAGSPRLFGVLGAVNAVNNDANVLETVAVRLCVTKPSIETFDWRLGRCRWRA